MNRSASHQRLFFIQTVFLLWRYAVLLVLVRVGGADDSSKTSDITSTLTYMMGQTGSATGNVGHGDLNIDPNGYIIYCPCMGRFGNQADHFLGSLGFAKKLNRTLILPPWRTYKNVPFADWFRVEAVEQYHRALPAESFMTDLAPLVWPQGKRIGWCWLPKKTEDGESYCPMKEGNPFGPFWDGLGVNFDQHIVYKYSYTEPAKWKNAYPGDQYPVIALKGAPASFPVSQEFAPLQRYLRWSEALEREATNYIQATFPNHTFLGIHLRNGPDWVNACNLAKGSTSFMASPQCLGYKGDKPVTAELCLPSPDTIVRDIRKAIQSSKATVVYVATDKDPMLDLLKEALGDEVKVIHQDPWLPQLDLLILGKAHHFIGNCVSSFTAFVARERRVTQRPTSFWAFAD